MARTSIASATRAQDDPQHGIAPEARLSAVRMAQGDVRVYQTKPGKGRVPGTARRTIDHLGLALERKNINQVQYDTAEMVRLLVERASLGGGKGRDSCCMSEVGGGEQTDESAARQADASKEMITLCGLMDQQTWLMTRDFAVGERTIKDWRPDRRDYRLLLMGLYIASLFWKKRAPIVVRARTKGE